MFSYDDLNLSTWEPRTENLHVAEDNRVTTLPEDGYFPPEQRFGDHHDGVRNAIPHGSWIPFIPPTPQNSNSNDDEGWYTPYPPYRSVF